MKYFTTLTHVISVVIILAAFEFFESECGKDILELKEANFDVVVNGSNFVFVIFYAPWNKRSVEALKTMEDVSEKMSKSEVILAKVNAYNEVKLATRFWIDNWPMFKFFIKGSVTPET